MISNDRDKTFRGGKQGERSVESLLPWSVLWQNEAETRSELWGITNTITTISKDNYLVIPVTKDNILMEQKTVIDKQETKKRKHGLPAEMLHLDNLPEELKGKKVYIRKLTPRECYRLMDVSEENIDKLMLPKDEKGKPIISNSGHYKLAGNSIVVSCMTAMFRNLILDPPERDKIDIKEAYPLFRDIDI